ncbi:MAG: ABC transporter permease [bacterium]|jgi:ABC-type uncharacterized transport system permease subunit
MWEALKSIVPLALTYTTLLLVVAMGGLYSERSGVVNIGLEGLMGFGAFAAAYFIAETYGQMGDIAIWLGLAAGALAGGAFSLLHAVACVTMRANQVVSGTAINILSSAVTIYLARSLTGSANILIIKGLIRGSVPVLSHLPVLGPLLFTNVHSTTFLALAIVLISWYVIYHRPFGLRLRACGENPHAADSMGVNVYRMRYIGVILSGVLSGLGGAIFIVTYAGEFSPLVYSGLGFLAIAALIFGKWKPWGVLGASLFFGMAKTVADMSRLFGGLKDMPNIIFNTFPYIATIIALVLFSKNAAGPRAAGEPYDVGKR